jgi:hypothetical protein
LLYAYRPEHHDRSNEDVDHGGRPVPEGFVEAVPADAEQRVHRRARDDRDDGRDGDEGRLALTSWKSPG